MASGSFFEPKVKRIVRPSPTSTLEALPTDFLQDNRVCQGRDQSLLGQSDSQFSLQTSDDELGFRARTCCEQLLDDTNLFGLRLGTTPSAHEPCDDLS